MGVPLRVGLSAASPRGAPFHYAPLRAFRYYPSRGRRAIVHCNLGLEANHKIR
ncbi:MAG: hypothetical protein LBB41_01655 [Prevotellaceae bacterium]|nr:hypothetical protein [Prevotellaceae bacterium]